MEAQDDRDLLKLLDKRCAELQSQHERDLQDVSELTMRCAELQNDLNACLDTLEQDHSHLVTPAVMLTPAQAGLQSHASQDEKVRILLQGIGGCLTIPAATAHESIALSFNHSRCSASPIDALSAGMH